MRCTLLTRKDIAFAVVIMHGHGPSNKMRTQLVKKGKVILAVNIATKGVIRTVHY